MVERLLRDGLALLLWAVAFVVVGTVLGLALLSALEGVILGTRAGGPAVNVVVTAVAGTAGTLLGRRYPSPDGVLPEPRWVLLVGPVAVALLSVVVGPEWDAALGGVLAGLATAALLAGDRSRR